MLALAWWLFDELRLTRLFSFCQPCFFQEKVAFRESQLVGCF